MTLSRTYLSLSLNFRTIYWNIEFIVNSQQDWNLTQMVLESVLTLILLCYVGIRYLTFQWKTSYQTLYNSCPVGNRSMLLIEIHTPTAEDINLKRSRILWNKCKRKNEIIKVSVKPVKVRKMSQKYIIWCPGSHSCIIYCINGLI